MNFLEEEIIFLDLISKNKINHMENGQAYTSLLLWEKIIHKHLFIKKVHEDQKNLLEYYLNYIQSNLKKINQLDVSIIEIFIVNKNLIGLESYPDMTKVLKEIITLYKQENMNILIENKIKQKILYSIENSKKILTLYLLEKYQCLQIMDDLANTIQEHFRQEII